MANQIYYSSKSLTQTTTEEATPLQETSSLIEEISAMSDSASIKISKTSQEQSQDVREVTKATEY